MATLVRTPLKPNAAVEDADRDFALDCSKELGYRVLQQKYEAPHNVADALRKLEIQPFTAKSVKKYKRRKQIIEAAKHRTIFSYTLGFIACACMVAIAPICFGIAWWNGCTLLGLSTGWYVPMTLLPGIIASAIFCSTTSDMRIYEVEWQQRELRNYYNPVPEFALQTALDVKKECPSAEMYVDELRIRLMPQPDPFLVIKDRNTGEEFYVEVWNEPKFKK